MPDFSVQKSNAPRGGYFIELFLSGLTGQREVR